MVLLRLTQEGTSQLGLCSRRSCSNHVSRLSFPSLPYPIPCIWFANKQLYCQFYKSFPIIHPIQLLSKHSTPPTHFEYERILRGDLLHLKVVRPVRFRTDDAPVKVQRIPQQRVSTRLLAHQQQRRLPNPGVSREIQRLICRPVCSIIQARL